MPGADAPAFITCMQDEQLQEKVENLQGRFKAAASMLGCLQDYFPKAKYSPGDAAVDKGPVVPGSEKFSF